MPIGDVYQLSVDQRVHDQQIVSVHYFRQESPDPPGVSAGQRLVDAWIAEVQALQLAFMTTASFINGYRTRRVFPIPSQFEQHVFAPQQGLDANASHDASTNVIASFYTNDDTVLNPTGNKQRKKRGRTYLAGVGLPSIIDGVITKALIDLIVLWIEKLLTTISESTDNTDWKKVLYDTTLDSVHDFVQGQSKTSAKTKKSRTQKTMTIPI